MFTYYVKHKDYFVTQNQIQKNRAHNNLRNRLFILFL